MDELREFLQTVRTHGLAAGRFRGLLHVLVGRRINREDGSVVSAGMTWRELAAVLKRVRWDRESVRELGLEPSDLPPRDREKFWYAAMARADLNGAQARAEGDALIEPLRPHGYIIGAAPAGGGG